MKDKNGKKKTVIALLAIFAIIGVVGYGVYSYYWTQGNITATSYYIELDKFDVSLYMDMHFLGEGWNDINESMTGGECENNNNGTYTCTWRQEISNNGSKSVVVEALDIEVSAPYGDSQLAVSDVTTNWENNTKTLEAGAFREYFEVTATLTLPGGGEAQQATDFVDRVEITPTVTYKFRATEVH